MRATRLNHPERQARDVIEIVFSRVKAIGRLPAMSCAGRLAIH
jgi:hypothetical protein